MPEINLRQHRFTHSACGPFTKNEFKKLKETRYSRYRNRNELGKTCFKHDMTDGCFKDLTL